MSCAKCGREGLCPTCCCNHRYHGNHFLGHPAVLQPKTCPSCDHSLGGRR